MSTGTALGKDDLFEKDAFKDAINGAQTLLTVIRDTKEEIRGSLAAKKSLFLHFKTKSYDDVKRLNVELKQAADLIKMKQQLEVAEIKVMEQQEKLAQTQIKTAIEKNRLNQQQLKSEVELTKAIEAETKANEKAAKSLTVLNGQYKQGVKDLAAIKQQLKELEYTGRTNGKVYKALSQDFAALNDKVRGAEQSVGEFQRNVGNYASGFNPLRNSINQLTREMPAFANSVQTGFMAISNNIPAFFDAIAGIKAANGELRAQGEPTKSVLSQLGGALFSWGTALSVGVTLLTVYGKELVNFIAEIVSGKDAIEAVNEALAKTYENSTKLIEAEIKAINALLVARGHLTEDEVSINEIQRNLAKERNARLRDYEKERKALLESLTNGDEIRKYGIMVGSLFANDQKAFVAGANKLREAAMNDINRMEITAAAEIETIRLKANKEKKVEITKEQEDELKQLEEFRKKRLALFAKWADIDRESEKDTEKTKFKSIQGDIQELEKQWLEGYSRFEEAQRKAAKEFNMSQDDLMAEFYKSGIEQFEEFLDKKRELLKKDKDLQKSVIEGVDKLVVNLDRIYKERFNKAKDYLDREIKLNENAIEQQQRLAERGLANTLAFEQSKAAKLQLERRRLQEQEIKQQKAVAFYNLLSGYAKTEPSTALQKAILETTLAEIVAGNFIEGTENVERDLKGNKVHSGQDGYMIAVDGKERIFNPKQNAQIGDISNDEAAQILADYQNGKLFNYGDTIQPIFSAPKQIVDMSATNELLKDVVNAVNSIPGNNFEFNKLGDLIHERINKAIKERTIYKNRI